MARVQVTVLLTALFFLISSGATLDFNVQVAPTPEASTFQPNSSSENYFNATVVLENSGSIGCEYRVRGDILQGDQELTRYSSSYRMWPGDIEDAEFVYLPINYTGDVKANLSLEYCEREKYIDSYSFQSEERIEPNRSIESKTLEAEERRSLVSFGVDEALLIPQEYPPYWKVGSVKVEEGKGRLEYNPTLFKEGEIIKYTVLQNGSVVGYTEVVLEDEEKWYEELLRTTSNWF